MNKRKKNTASQPLRTASGEAAGDHSIAGSNFDNLGNRPPLQPTELYHHLPGAVRASDDGLGRMPFGPTQIFPPSTGSGFAPQGETALDFSSFRNVFPKIVFRITL